MKIIKQSRLITALSFLTVLLTSVPSIQALAVTHELNEDNHFIRVIIPEEFADKMAITYPLNGEDFTTSVKHGEVVSLSIQSDTLEKLSIPFTAQRIEDEVVLQIGDPDADSLNPVIGFHSTLEAAGIVKEPTITLTVPGASVQVIYSTGNIQDELAPGDAVYPMDLDESLKDFLMDGVLDIQFFVKAANVEEGGDGDGNDGDVEGEDADQDLQDQISEGSGSGGCSFAAGAAASGNSLALLGLLLPLFLGLRKRLK